MLFDDIERDLEGPAGAADAHFTYLNLAARIEAVRVRALVEDWFSRYPEAHRAGLAGRFRSPIDDRHFGAFFELAVHELLLHTGHTIVEIEPRLPHTDRSPDFLVEAPDGQRFYLEATATGTSGAATAADARLNQAIAAIERVQSPAHFLDLTIDGKPTLPVTLKTLRRRLSAWIASLPDDESARDIAPFEYEEHGARFTIKAIVLRKRRDGPNRTIGGQFNGAFWATPGDGIRECVERKASRYGKLDLPYVVAVDGMGVHHDEEHALDALMGSPCVVLTTHDDGRVTHRASRSPNGVWNGDRGPRKRGVSAVFSVDRLDPWSVGQRRARLIRNPWALHPLPPIPLGIDEINPVDGRWVRTAGNSLAEIFGLPPGWPEVDI